MSATHELGEMAAIVGSGKGPTNGVHGHLVDAALELEPQCMALGWCESSDGSHLEGPRLGGGVEWNRRRSDVAHRSECTTGV